jgi:Na+/H+-dicarboxylate symporter
MRLSSPTTRLLLAVALGIALGLLARAIFTPATWQTLGVADSATFLRHVPNPANDAANFIAILCRVTVDATDFLGRVYVRLLQVCAIPLIICSLLLGAASLTSAKAFTKLGLRTLILFAIMAIIAAGLGLLLAGQLIPAKTIDPAVVAAFKSQTQPTLDRISAGTTQVQGFWSFLLDSIPNNLFASLASGNTMQIIVITLIVSAGMLSLSKLDRDRLLGPVESLAKLVGWLVDWLIRLAPIGAICLLAPVVARLGADALRELGLYCLVVFIGMCLLLFIEYPLLIAALAKRSPLAVFKGILPALTTAFATSSSAATLPVTLRCVTDTLKVPRPISAFVCSLGTTINMDGTAMYQAMAVLFIARIYGIDLSTSQQIALLFMAVLAAVGAPGIPSGGMVILTVLLASFGAPAEGITLLLAVDPLLDRLRTVVNVAGDAVASVIMQNLGGVSASEMAEPQAPPSPPMQPSDE